MSVALRKAAASGLMGRGQIGGVGVSLFATVIFQTVHGPRDYVLRDPYLDLEYRVQPIGHESGFPIGTVLPAEDWEADFADVNLLLTENGWAVRDFIPIERSLNK